MTATNQQPRQVAGDQGGSEHRRFESPSGTWAARERVAELVTAHLEVAERAVSRYPRHSVLTREELRAEALYGLFRAARQYEAQQRERPGLEFWVFAHGYVRRQLNYALGQAWKRRQRFELYATDDLPELSGERDEWRDPAEVVVQGETVADVREGLAELGARDREVLVAVYLEGRSQAEVARAQGVSRNRIGVILRRAEERMGRGWERARLRGETQRGQSKSVRQTRP